MQSKPTALNAKLNLQQCPWMLLNLAKIFQNQPLPDQTSFTVLYNAVQNITKQYCIIMIKYLIIYPAILPS